MSRLGGVRGPGCPTLFPQRGSPHRSYRERCLRDFVRSRGAPARAHRLARKCDVTVDYAKFISEENEEAERYLKTDLSRDRSSTGANPYVQGGRNAPRANPTTMLRPAKSKPKTTTPEDSRKTTLPKAQEKIIHVPNQILMPWGTRSGFLLGKERQWPASEVN